MIVEGLDSMENQLDAPTVRNDMSTINRTYHWSQYKHESKSFNPMYDSTTGIVRIVNCSECIKEIKAKAEQLILEGDRLLAELEATPQPSDYYTYDPY